MKVDDLKYNWASNKPLTSSETLPHVGSERADETFSSRLSLGSVVVLEAYLILLLDLVFYN